MSCSKLAAACNVSHSLAGVKLEPFCNLCLGWQTLPLLPPPLSYLHLHSQAHLDICLSSSALPSEHWGPLLSFTHASWDLLS